MSLSTMIHPHRALSIILQQAQKHAFEQIPLREAYGRVLAQDLFSDADIPPFANSAMDGYAIIAADSCTASRESPAKLQIIDVIPAGSMTERIVHRGTAMRIMTGAPLPAGADAVIKIEDTRMDGNDILILVPAEVGQYVRAAGEDIPQGEHVIPAGTYIGPAEMGMLARLGIGQVLVSQRPRVAILTTGNELVDVGKPLSPGQIYDSNQYSLLGQCISAGAIPSFVMKIPDSAASIMEAINSACETCDVIITSGGVSMGEYDHIKTALREFADMAFWEVAIKPGKPFAYGHIAGIPVFALPGNPVSSMVTFDLFVRPALQHMAGMTPEVEMISARTSAMLRHTPGRTEYVRASTHWHDDGYLAIPTGDQGSGRLRSMLGANSYLVIPEDIEDIPAGSQVQVRFIS